MAKRMTVIFEDDELYTSLKVEAAKKGRYAKDIVAEAVREWLEAREDEELSDGLGPAREEWAEHGGAEAGEFFRSLNSANPA